VEPPQAVLVNPMRIWPNAISQRVILSGQLLGWARTAAGDWMALICTDVQLQGRSLPLTMLVRHIAVRPDAQLDKRGDVLDFPDLRAVRPTVPVLIHPGRLWPPLRFRSSVETALFVKSQGIQLNQIEIGELRGWVRGRGRWLAHVEWTVPLQGVGLHQCALLPADAIRLATPEQLADRDGLRTAAVWR
jgi:hypothetical protein